MTVLAPWLKIISTIRSSLWYNWAYRALGVHVRSDAIIDTYGITDYDLVTIGDHAVIEDGAGLQPHTFEHRVLKRIRVDVAPGTVVGSRALMLAGASTEQDVQIDPSSLVLGGDVLPAGTRWGGVPAQFRFESELNRAVSGRKKGLSPTPSSDKPPQSMQVTASPSNEKQSVNFKWSQDFDYSAAFSPTAV